MREKLFDRAEEYEAMLERGIKLSGEQKEYFLKGRVDLLRRLLPPAWSPRRILDFGCGTGETSTYLADVFAEAEVIGTDTAREALEYAASRVRCSRVSFRRRPEPNLTGPFDLCYVSGVFHHIERSDRSSVALMLLAALAPGGFLALFENNPWNPATRLVMKRIPFDRNAAPLPPPEARMLVRNAGFRLLGRTAFLFYFPRPLAFLRPLERHLLTLPLGAQYCVLAAR